MRPLTSFKRREIAGPDRCPLNVPHIHFGAIVKSTGPPLCVGVQDERQKRRIVEVRFFDSDSLPGSIVVIQLAIGPLLLLLLHYIVDSPSEWMNRVLAISGTSRLPWMGAGLSRSGPRKGQPAGFHVRGALPPGLANSDTSVPLSTKARDLESVWERKREPGAL